MNMPWDLRETARAAAIFFIVLFAALLAVALLSGGALRAHGLVAPRLLVLSAAFLFSLFVTGLVLRLTPPPPPPPPPPEPAVIDDPVIATAPSWPGPLTVAEAVRQGMRPALGIAREFPPRLRVQDHSVFGGLPIAPPTFRWPRSGETPLAFMAQIDCAELPVFADRELLPLSGVLYFFIGFDDSAPAVIHLPGPAADWVKHAPPADAPPIFGRAATAAAPWIAHTNDAEQRLPRSFPRWPLRIAAVETYGAENPFEGTAPEAVEYDRVSRQRRVASLAKAFGPPVPWRSLQSQGARRPGRAWRPFEGFPQTWRTIEWAAGAMIVELSGLSEVSEAIRAEALDWLARARAEPAMAAPDDGAKAAFWVWLDRAPAPAVNRALESIASLSAEVSLSYSTDSAARIPAKVVELLRARHHPLRRSPATGDVHIGLAHQILGHPLRLRDRLHADDHRLLLQLVRDPAMLWSFGDGGVYQFWIKDDDLRSGRFEAVKLTFASL